MRRTQLYFDEDLWQALHAKAMIEKTTVSDLVRTAVRERYMGSLEERRAAMMAVVGIWKDRTDCRIQRLTFETFAMTDVRSDSEANEHPA